MAAGTKTVIYAALIGNSLIAVSKGVAATLTGSSAMLSEAIHSVVDTGNQGLMLYGLSRSKKPADAKHPFGYGAEIYFWSFVVAILIFAVGSGISIYEGIQKLLHPHPITDIHINFIVLGAAMVFEAVAWWIAWKAFSSTKGKRSFYQAVRQAKDPAIITVLFEDTAAMLGLIAATVGLLISYLYDIEEADGIASIIIGIILAGTALILAIETKGLLIGERASRETIDGVEELISQSEGIHKFNEMLTLHIGPDDVLVTVSVDFDDRLDATGIENIVAQLEAKIQEKFPRITRIYISAHSWTAHRARKLAANDKQPQD